ncbi:MAG: molybdenum cofactor guanylyltransferase [Desulfobacterales bacterium]
MKFPCSGVILAGGENRRFMGQNKAFCRINGKRTIDRIYPLFRSVFSDIILVTNTPSLYLEFDATIVCDILPVRSSLTGIHAGLFYADTPYAFISACDTPFLEKALVEHIVSQIEDRYDAIIPQTGAGMEPLCAVYAKKALNRIESSIHQRKLKIQSVFKKNRIKIIPEQAVRMRDNRLASFFNINTPQDLATAENMLNSK